MIQSLKDTPFNTIYDAFIDAFSDYEAKIELTIDQLKAMVLTRSYNPGYSRGYFENDEMAGFLLVGYREIGGEKIFYDTATGIRRDYQKNGIGDALLKEILMEMDSKAIDRFVLEVLENNIPAQDLYKKNGFKIVRRLCCFEYELKNITGNTKYAGVLNNTVENNYLESCTFYPTWQNSNESFENCKDEYSKIDFHYGNEVVGYVIINKNSGSTLQLGIEKAYRTLGNLEEILLCLKNEFGVERIRFLNIEDGSEMHRLLSDFGMRNFINQLEMELKGIRT